MKSKTIIFLLLAFGTSLVQAQNIKNRINFKTGFSRYNSISKVNNEFEKVPNISFDVNYGILKFLETGINLGFSKFDVYYINQFSTSYRKEKSLATYYGANVNFHILPLFVEAEDFRFDFYATAKIGERHLSGEEGNVPKNEFIWASGLGMSFYPWKKTGFFVESTYGKYNFHDAFVESFTDNINWRYGLTFKFK